MHGRVNVVWKVVHDDTGSSYAAKFYKHEADFQHEWDMLMILKRDHASLCQWC